MQLYNTLTKQLQDFAPQDGKTIKMYSCGPTVYYRAHIGNFSAYLMSDLLVRWFSSRHLFSSVSPWQVKKVSNITDVGHLVSDGDTGEDKMEKAAREQQKSVLDIARHFEELYHQDEAKLQILPAAAYPRATEYISQMISLVQGLVEKGYAYETEDGIYFSVEKFPSYGALSGNTLEQLATGAGGRVKEEHQLGKRHPADFALWKKVTGTNAQHSLRWPSPWGEGFPGWHIECSAMILATLGEQIDLHTGGEDNIFPHHECEIAQMEAYTGKSPFCRFWLHKRFIQINAEKMSKSKGNGFNLDDVIAQGYDPLDLRYLFLSAHYRTQLNFTWEALSSAKEARQRLITLARRLQESHSGEDITPIFRQAFFNKMEEDLNTSGALAVVFDFLKEANTKLDQGTLDTASALTLLSDMNSVFAFYTQADNSIPAEVQALLDARTAARVAKDFAASDRLRDEIQALGYELKDTPQGQKIFKL